MTLVLIHGQFSALDAAKYLTSLHIIGASATSEYSGACVDTLVKLKLDDASLYNFCTSACSRLQDLEVYDSLNGCEHGTVVDLCTGHGQPWINMSGLTALTKLQVSYTKQQYFVWHLDWLFLLTKLQFVKIQTYTIEVVLPRTIGALTDLVELHLDCYKTYFDFKWNLLTLLERLCVYRGTVLCKPHCPLSGL